MTALVRKAPWFFLGLPLSIVVDRSLGERGEVGLFCFGLDNGLVYPCKGGDLSALTLLSRVSYVWWVRKKRALCSALEMRFHFALGEWIYCRVDTDALKSH
jgi:hypothetical protein